MLQAFSHALVDLYESAESVGLNDFPAEVVRQVGRLVEFDGAVLGMGESPAVDPNNLVIHNALVHGRDPGILADYAEVSLLDPMTHKFVAGLTEPLTGSFSAIEPAKSMDALRAFHKAHDLEHLILFGDGGSDRSPARWLVLYRGTGDPFDLQARQHVAAVWPHIERALSTNRSRFLQRQSSQSQNRGAALIGSSGCIEAAEPRFRRLCALEWPAGVGRKLPDPVWDSWRRGMDYTGTRVTFKKQLQHGDFIVGQARALGPLDRLTPAERLVAARFAAGQSAKAIARSLGVSIHTVRSQLAQVYGKLDIHDKGELASVLLADSAEMPTFHGG